MSEANHSAVDVSIVQDPNARRVLRAMQQEYSTALAHQQAEIDAIIDVLLEKHVTSIGELRRHAMKIQQNAQAGGGRTGRLHEALWGSGAAASGAQSPSSHTPGH